MCSLVEHIQPGGAADSSVWWGHCLLPVSYLSLARRQLTSQPSFSPGEQVVMFRLADVQLLRGQVAVLMGKRVAGELGNRAVPFKKLLSSVPGK